MAALMTSDSYSRLASRLLPVVGVGDVAAGLALAGVPAAVLPLAGLTPPGAEALVFLRWVGIFAAAVGAAYLLGGCSRAPGALRWTLLLTLPFRAGTGVFVTWALVRGALALPWAAVAAVNLGLVAAQAALLAKGAGRAV